jgi:hypothetical protein
VTVADVAAPPERAPAAPPALFDHCVQIYEAMEADSEKRTEEGNLIDVWEGFMTKLFSTQGMSVPYYTSVRNALMGMDCIRQMRRGGGSSPSVWMLVRKPTTELFNAFAPANNTTAQRRASKKTVNGMLEQRQIDLMRRIEDLEKRVDACEDQLLRGPT